MTPDRKMSAEEIVVAGMLVAMDQDQHSRDELVSTINLMALCEGFTSEEVATAKATLLSVLGGTHELSEYVIRLGGEYFVSGRGRALLSLAQKKLAVNEVIGEPGENFDVGKQDIQGVLDGNPDLPG